MNLIIDDNDGQGGRDYTQALLESAPLHVTRKRGEWTRCEFGLDVAGAGLPTPGSRARVTVTDGSATILFQGYLVRDAIQPEEESTGDGVESYPFFEAAEDAWVSGTLPGDELQPSTVKQHALNLTDVTLHVDAFQQDTLREFATSVTVAGEDEASAYLTELFRGDGVTASFALSHQPYKESSTTTIVTDSFDDATLNTTIWTRMDTGNYLVLGSGGLQMAGGTGIDGSTLLTYQPQVELGGTLIAEVSGLALNVGSDGILIGFYNGTPSEATCIAGVRVRGDAGAHAFVAVANGVEQSTTYDFAAGHTYSLRVRLHCPEIQRVLGTYAALVDGTLQQFGGGTVSAPLRMVVELQDEGLASSTLATVLYDGAIAAAPAQCTFGAVNSRSLSGSIGSVALQQAGSAWVVSTKADGSLLTRREGPKGSGTDFSLSTTGVVNFDSGRVPEAGELVTVSYRRKRPALVQLTDANAEQTRLQLGLPGLPAASFHVLSPKARSSTDCHAAGQALLALANGSETGLAGSVAWMSQGALTPDVQPSDVLAVTEAGGTQNFVVQSVTVTDGHCVPEILTYKAAFTQKRATSLSFTVSEALPAYAETALPAVLPQGAPASLSGLQVTTATTTSLGMDAGVDPPVGGGFEVRRSDANFGTAATSDLVLTSPTRSFDLNRQAFAERFFVRMYDGSTPRKYSAVSSVVLTHLPTS